MIHEQTLTIETAPVFEPLLEPSRYKGAFGGRGSGKSHFFAEKMIEDHLAETGMLSICAREIQKSIKESSKRLLESKIDALQLGNRRGFKIFEDKIETPGDGIIVFAGLQDHTSESIKSFEGFKRVWIEEGQTVGARSIQILRPTIRASGSEIWASWNPRRKTDAIDKMFRGGEPPTNAIVIRANWNDNPWFPAELEQERLDCLRAEPDQYAHTWDGDYVTIMTGAYYAKQLLAAKREGRTTGRVPIEPLMTVRAFWDIGGTGAKADACAIWIAQFIGKEIRIVDYYEAIGQPLSVHLAWLRSKGYDGCLCVLPHDAASHEKVEKITYDGAIKASGFPTLVIPNQGAGAAFQRIEASRRLFPAMWFDSVNCETGLETIGWYHEKKDVARNIGLGPMHDWSSHGSDAFGLISVSYEKQMKEKKPPPPHVKPFAPTVKGMGY